MARFDELVETVSKYQTLVQENYARTRRLAEELRAGLCDYIGATDGICVQLVPPAGPFEPKPYGDKAFSIPPRGFRALGPIGFGLAVRVTRGTDWMRVTLLGQTVGSEFHLAIQGGDSFRLKLPVSDHEPSKFYEYVFNHVLNSFQTQIDLFERGEYGQREIGFDFSREAEPAEA